MSDETPKKSLCTNAGESGFLVREDGREKVQAKSSYKYDYVEN